MHLRSLYWILAAASLLIVTTVLTVPVPNGDFYYENTLSENGRFFANQTEYGQYREEHGFIHPETGIITVTGFTHYDGSFLRNEYEYQLVQDAYGYHIVEKPSRPSAGAGAGAAGGAGAGFGAPAAGFGAPAAGFGGTGFAPTFPPGEAIESKLILSLLGGGRL